MWAQVERLVNLAECKKSNEGKPRTQWKRPTLFAAIATLADACNVSYNTARDCIKEFVERGLLTPRFKMGKEPAHRDSGRWQTHDYDVMLHDEYALFNPCPPFRFCRRNGGMVVKAELRKTTLEETTELSERFRNKAGRWAEAVLNSDNPEAYSLDNPPPAWPKSMDFEPEEYVKLRREKLDEQAVAVARN